MNNPAPSHPPIAARNMAYVRAAATLTAMPLTAERETAVGVIFDRLAEYAADVAAFAIGDDVEIPGPGEP